MKKSLLFSGLALAVAMLVFGLSAFQSGRKFYYAFDEKIPLEIMKDKAVIRYKNAVNRASVTAAMRTAAGNVSAEWQDDRTVIITTGSDDARKQAMQKADAQGEIVASNPVYALATGLEMGVTDEILVKFLEKVSEGQMDSLHRRFGVTVVKTTDIYQLLRVGKGGDALETANRYQECGLVLFSHPNFISRVEKHQAIPNDQFFNRQFYLNNTGQLIADGHTGTPDADVDGPEAWVTTRGNNNIIVAVLDEGVTPNHPDLPNARQVRLNGSNFASTIDGTNANDPSPTGNNNHGNSCAGVVGATQGNNEGISGLAPACRIMPVRIPIGLVGGTAQQHADGITFARNNGAHVISNSWGYNSDNPNFLPVIVSAIQDAVTNGRGGLGCVVVFSASNSARHTQGDNGQVRFPGNVNIAGVITVGASDRNDRQADYSPSSNPGSVNNQIIDVVAPSHRAYPPAAYAPRPGGIAGETFEAWTIDIPLNTGYNPWPNIPNQIVPPAIGEQLPNAGINFQAYTGRFGGTSHACPQVAATAALMLSINPNLTQQQVFNIITGTADRVGGYVYANGRSNELGSGRLNACSAVRQAVGTLALTATTDPICTSSTFTVANLPAGLSVAWSSSNPAGLAVNAAGVATRVGGFNGSVTVTATIAGGACGAVQVNRPVWLGGPVASGAVAFILPPEGVSPGQILELEAPNIDASSSYSWSVQGGTFGGGISNGQRVTVVASQCVGQVQYQWLNVQLAYTNACGTVQAFGGSTTIICGGGSGSFAVFPNPAGGELNVVATDGGAPAEAGIESGLSVDENVEAEVTLLTAYSQPLRQGKLSNGRLKLKTAGVHDGLYYLQIRHKDGVETRQVLIRH